LTLVDVGNQAGATTRVTDLETAWDNSEARLKPRDTSAWHDLDDKIDAVLRALRSTQPDPGSEKATLNTLLDALAPSASSAPSVASAPSVPATDQPALPPRQPALGDLTAFRKITQDTLALLNAGDQRAATARVTDLETSWDNAEARLKPKNKTAWTQIDGKIDTVLRQMRSTSPNPASEKAALTDLLKALR
jgi:hypothetical protein